jgi:SAM-dependent methyltransferase
MSLFNLLMKYCRACGRRSRLQRLGKVKATHPGRFHTSRFGLVHCPACDVVYLDPPPSPSDLSILYCDSDQFTDDHYTAPDQVAKILEYYSHALRTLHLLPGDNTRVLEIGAGFAWVSRACKDIDPSSRTTAQDVTDECARKCPWVDHYHVGLLDEMPESELYDVASMTHVIEHLVDPAAMLRSISARLRSGGKLFVTAPFRPPGWTPRLGIEPWLSYQYLHVPAHVTYLTRNWFDEVAPRASMRLIHWDARHDKGQAFEAVLQKD